MTLEIDERSCRARDLRNILLQIRVVTLALGNAFRLILASRCELSAS
ncbi:hypothetical protein [Bradyrhizobium sacchari]|nr:hypothetical protein [Bradyrhizobium sacchari]